MCIMFGVDDQIRYIFSERCYCKFNIFIDRYAVRRIRNFMRYNNMFELIRC